MEEEIVEAVFKIRKAFPDLRPRATFRLAKKLILLEHEKTLDDLEDWTICYAAKLNQGENT